MRDSAEDDGSDAPSSKSEGDESKSDSSKSDESKSDESKGDKSREKEDLEDAARTALLESRTVLPGIQTLFGFQLTVVFTEPFHNRLSRGEHWLHVFAMALVLIAIALVMLPAVYHRQVHPDEVSKRLVRLWGTCMTASLVPLMFALSTELYLLVVNLFQSRTVALVFGMGALLMFVGMWFVYPRAAQHRARRSVAHRGAFEPGRALRPSGG